MIVWKKWRRAVDTQMVVVNICVCVCVCSCVGVFLCVFSGFSRCVCKGTVICCWPNERSLFSVSLSTQQRVFFLLTGCAEVIGIFFVEWEKALPFSRWLVFLTWSCSMFLMTEDIFKENYAKNCIYEYFFIQIVMNQRLTKSQLDKACSSDSILIHPLVNKQIHVHLSFTSQRWHLTQNSMAG